MQTFEAADIARLDRAYSTPQIVDQRRRFRAAVAARPGEIGLDVGCGAGQLACELAREVAPGGRIVAIDKSSQSVEASAARAANEKLADVIDVRTAMQPRWSFLTRASISSWLSRSILLFQMSLVQSRKQCGYSARAVGCWCSNRTGTCMEIKRSALYSPDDFSAGRDTVCPCPSSA
jgi:trans-aconitate methyltransferase